MKKRTLIIFAVAILAIVAGVVSMYFEYKKTIDEANDIIASTEPEIKPKAEKKKVIVEPVNTPDNGTGTGTDETK
jgi:uncharacterized protein YoxC